MLAFYLDYGFNIGDDEYNRIMHLNLMLKSKELDPYFVGTHEGIAVPKPELAMTSWWKDLLDRLATRKPENWLESSFILLNTTRKDQEKFEKELNRLRLKIQTGKVKHEHNQVVFLSGPERRRYLIVGYLYTTTDKEKRNSMIMEIINSEEAENTRGAIVIGFNTNKNDYPYSVIASKSDTDLFDI